MLKSGIAMHAAQQVVDTEIGDEDGKESGDHIEVIETRIAEGSEGGFVERHGIDHQGDEGPRLLGVPRPVAAPRHIGPDGAQKDADGEQEYGGIEQQL